MIAISPDFTHPKVRSWWSGQFKKFIKESGARGIWNDMNEPAVLEVGTFPMDTRHDYDGHPCSHRKAHNVYGMQMSRASYNGLKKAIDPLRPFLITRSGYAGTQRYAATWTGDNLSTWEHLWMANIQTQRLSISGYSFAGSDVGGFIGRANGELLTRWTQLGVFHPFFRNHSSGDHGDQEPWSFGEPYTSAIRRAIELRYQLLPYIYTLFWRNHTYGSPIVNPLSFLAQDDPETHYRMEEFGMGQDLLVCPISAPGVEGRLMYLPEGDWYNYWTNERVEGKKELWVDAALDIVPLFVRAGAIIPQAPLMNYVGEKELEYLELHAYIGEDSYTSQLYEDAGEYNDHSLGNYMLRSFTLQSSSTDLHIRQYMKGRFYDAYNSFQLYLHGLSFHPSKLVLDGQEIEATFQQKDKLYVVEVDKNFDELVIS